MKKIRFLDKINEIRWLLSLTLKDYFKYLKVRKYFKKDKNFYKLNNDRFNSLCYSLVIVSNSIEKEQNQILNKRKKKYDEFMLKKINQFLVENEKFLLDYKSNQEENIKKEKIKSDYYLGIKNFKIFNKKSILEKDSKKWREYNTIDFI